MNKQTDDIMWMHEAINLAKRAEQEGEVPVGAVLVQDGKILGQGWNRPIVNHDCSAHAEIQALRNAGEVLQNYRFPGSTLYVSLEPCTMCAGAMIHARIKRIVFGAYDLKTGAIESVVRIFDQPFHNHKPLYVGGVLEEECRDMLQAFFKKKRL